MLKNSNLQAQYLIFIGLFIDGRFFARHLLVLPFLKRNESLRPLYSE